MQVVQLGLRYGRREHAQIVVVPDLPAQVMEPVPSMHHRHWGKCLLQRVYISFLKPQRESLGFSLDKVFRLICSPEVSVSLVLP